MATACSPSAGCEAVRVRPAMEVDSPMGWVARFGEGRIASIRTYVSVADAREAAEFRG